MLTYQANEETTHFVNWVLLSGTITPAELVAQAKKNGKKIVAEEPPPPGMKPEQCLAIAVQSDLSMALECFLDVWTEEVCPGFEERGHNYGGRWRWGRDYSVVRRGGWPFPDRADFYQNSDPFFLVAPLLASAFHRIDFDKSARLILGAVSPDDETCKPEISYFANGYGWAKTQAESGQLFRLKELAEGMNENEWDQWFDTRSRDAYTAAERLFFIIAPDQEGDREATAAFWRKEMEDYEVRQFADGAIQCLGDK